MSYTNPVYAKNFPDPFCLAFDGIFYCFASGFWEDGRVFGVITSTDLVHWEERPGAMEPQPEGHPHYWAPEVAYLDGQFYLYYSVGNEEIMHLRVAVADHPGGPYTDSGVQLTREPFAIDAHVFVDDDGARYLFYASDHLTRDRVGTGTVVDRMIDPLHLEGKPSPVSLPAFDWQIFDPRRASKGNARWHTIEGSFALKHRGRYYQMFSGGNYQNISYGVSYAVTDDIQARQEWRQVTDGEKTLPILCTLPGKVFGPGHNSVVLGPDQRQLYCVYHIIESYDPLIRIVAIDPLEWVGDELAVLGPSYSPQPGPIRAEDPLNFGQVMQPGRTWEVRTGTTLQAEIWFEQPYFLLSATIRAAEQGIGDSTFGTAWRSANGQDLLWLTWLPAESAVLTTWLDEQGAVQQKRTFLPAFRFDRPHAFRMALNGRWAQVHLDGAGLLWEGSLAGQPERAIFFAEGSQEGTPAAVISSAGITYGCEDNFWQSPPVLRHTGWQTLEPEGATGEPGRMPNWRLMDGYLQGTAGEEEALLIKDLSLGNYELVVNVRGADASFIIFPAISNEAEVQPFLWIADGAFHLQTESGVERAALEDSPAEGGFYHIRCRKVEGRLRVQVGQQVCGDYRLAVGETAAGSSMVGLGVRQGTAQFDMVRITKIV